MKSKIGRQGITSTALDLDSPLGRLALINIELAQQRIQEQEIGITTSYAQKSYRIIFEHTHYLYDHLFYIYALRLHDGKINEHIECLIASVEHQAVEILDYLKTDPGKDFSSLDEQLRWEYLIGAYLIILTKIQGWQNLKTQTLSQCIIEIIREVDFHVPYDSTLIRAKLAEHLSCLTKRAHDLNTLSPELLIVRAMKKPL